MNHWFKSLAVSTIAALSITSLSSCDLDSLSSNGDTCSWGNTLTDIFDLATGADCNQTKADYTKTVTKQGSLLSIETVESRMQRYPKRLLHGPRPQRKVDQQTIPSLGKLEL